MSRSARLVDLDGETELLVLTSSDAPQDDPLLFEQFDLGYPDVREDATDLVDDDGTDDGTRYVGALGISGEFVAQSAGGRGPWEWIERLRALSHPSRRVFFYMRTEGWSDERRILVRPVSVVAPHGSGVPTGQAQWKAPVGLWEAAEPSEVVVLTDGGATAGLSAPLSAPLSATPANIPGAVTVLNDGSVDSPPVIDIYGPCTSPKVTLDPDRIVTFPGLLVPAGVFLRVDMAGKTATFNGDPAQSKLTARDFTVSTWWRLPPGRSTLTFTATDPGSDCRAVVSWRDRTI